MKVLLDVNDNKADFVMELLNSLSFVKVRPLSDPNAVLVEEIWEAVTDLKLVRKGELEARSARELIKEL